MFHMTYDKYDLSYEKVRYTSPFLFITPVAVLGILLAKFVMDYYLALFLVGFLLSILIFLHVIKRKYHHSSGDAILKIFPLKNILLLSALCLSFVIRYHQVASFRSPNEITRHNIKKIRSITGTITETHYFANNYHRYIVNLEKAYFHQSGHIFVKGKILVNTADIGKEYHYGDYIQCYGSIEEPQGQRNPGQFDYRAYLVRKDIFYTLSIGHSDSVRLLAEGRGNFFLHTVIIPMGQYARQVFIKYLSQPARALLNALILGERQDIEKEVINDFQRVGVIHVLAISGLHVGFLIIFLMALFSLLRVPYPLKVIVLFIVLSGFVILINFKAPVVRASLMVMLFILGNLLERKVNAVQIILASAFIILIIEPREIFDPGFQFSYLAVLSIFYGYIIFARFFSRYFKATGRLGNNRYLLWLLKWIWIPFFISLSAIIGTLPLTVYYYGYLPIVAVIVNIFIIPLIGFILISGFFLLMLSNISLFFTQGVASLINISVKYLYSIIHTISTFPLAAVDLPKPPLIIIVMIIISLYLVISVKRKYRLPAILFTGIIIIITVIAGFKIRNELRVTFLDVGHGDAIHLRFPNGNSLLIDGGESSFYCNYGKNTVIPFLKQECGLHLKYVVLSHPHKDHLSGLMEVLQVAAIDTIVLSPYPYHTRLYKNLLVLCKRKRIPIRYVSRGDQLYPDPGCRVYILHPSREFSNAYDFGGTECNNSSVVLKIQHGENGILLTGDIEKDAEMSLLHYGDFLECEVLKVAHHGGGNSSTIDFLHYVNPLVAVISVGKKSRFNQPADLTLDRLRMVSTATLQTCHEGAVVLEVGDKEIKKIDWR
jgi:competence protein ComEC